MITVKDLENAGYRQYKTPSIHPEAICLWQKAVRNVRPGRSQDQVQKLYFINFYQWKLNSEYRAAEFTTEVRMYTDGAGRDSFDEPQSFDLNYFTRDIDTVKIVEDFYANAYKVLNCIPDYHNND